MNEKTQKSLLLNNEEKEIIERASKVLGLTYAGFLRTCALQQAKRILFENKNFEVENGDR